MDGKTPALIEIQSILWVAGTEQPSPTLHISCQSNTIRNVFVEDQVLKYDCLLKSVQEGFME